MADTLPIDVSPLGGYDGETNLVRLGPNLASDTLNFLYEAQQIKRRPGFTTVQATGVTGPVTFVDKVVCNAVSYSIYINAAGDLFYVASGIGSGPILGPGTAFGDPSFGNLTSIIGEIVIANNTGGLVLWDPTVLANPYTVVAAAKYRYVAGQQGRAVAAYDTSLPLLTGPRTFGWSKPGDLTVWTSADGSAGSEAIAEIDDEITGLGVLHNIVVLPRRYGIHLAYPTGTLPLPYNVQSFIKRGMGIWYPSTAVWTDELLLGVGEDNVYQFDLQSLTPIGFAIRAELLQYLNGGTTYRGVITRYNSVFTPRYRYHLVPINNADATHFVLDIKDQTWGRHNRAAAMKWAWNLPSPASVGLGDFGFAYVDGATNPPNINYWDTSVVCEQSASWTKYIGAVNALTADFQIEDVIIHYQDFGANDVTVTIVGQGSQGPVTTTTTVSVGGANDGAWKRAFLSRTSQNIRQTGNDFVITCAVAADGNPFVMDQLTVLSTAQGDYRGQ